MIDPTENAVETGGQRRDNSIAVSNHVRSRSDMPLCPLYLNGREIAHEGDTAKRANFVKNHAAVPVPGESTRFDEPGRAAAADKEWRNRKVDLVNGIPGIHIHHGRDGPEIRMNPPDRGRRTIHYLFVTGTEEIERWAQPVVRGDAENNVGPENVGAPAHAHGSILSAAGLSAAGHNRTSAAPAAAPVRAFAPRRRTRPPRQGRRRGSHRAANADTRPGRVPRVAGR